MGTSSNQLLKPERGASAVLIAFGMVVLLGVAAVAIDLSAAFNERNQNQIAGDNGVMAGAMEKADQNPDAAIVDNALDFVRANLTAEFTGPNDPSWIAMWQSCVDAGNPNWVPLPQPAAWGGGTLDCISQTTSLLRIRIPNQLLDTTFGNVLGANSVTTNAVSIAKTVLLQTAPPVVPFGIASGSTPGEFCLSSASNGNAYPPCTGSQTGAFGPIISPLFGDFGDHAPECAGNTIRWFERNLVWGLDHQLEPWPHANTIPASPPTPYPQPPGDLSGLSDINRDACILDPDGNPAPINGIPINTVQVDTGFPDPGVTNALVSDMTFDGRPSRLQLPTTATRELRDQNDIWDVDNVGPWRFLTDGSPIAECQGSTYISALDTDTKVARFEACISNPGIGEVFSLSITSSPRFVWAPEYVYDSPPGQKFTPIRDFRPVFLAGVWMNCPNPNSGNPCGAVFFPDEDETSQICDVGGGGCKKVTVDQISSWLLPDASLPPQVFNDFNSAFDNKEAELYQ